MRKVLSIVLIGSGCIILGAALFMRFYTNQQSSKLITEYYKSQEGLNSLPQSELNINADFNEEDVELFDLSTYYEEGDVMGILRIPKIDLEVALAQGVSNDTLKYAVGHFEETALPGEVGNCAITGHRNYTYGEFFNRLDELEISDVIEIIYGSKLFSYSVTGKEVVEPTQLEVLDQGDEVEVTLITCTPIRTGTHRLIIKGILEHIE